MNLERELQVDVCIVGSGPAGAVLAASLAGRGKRIAIVEAGSWQDEAEHARRLATGDAAQLALDHPHLHVPMRLFTPTNWMYWQIRKVGGNSRIWGGWCPRGLENHFRMRSRWGIGEDWPISYDELEPYYGLAEEELGVGGELPADHPPRRSRPFPLPPLQVDYVGHLFAEACTRLGWSWERVQSARPVVAYRGRDVCRYCNTGNCMNCTTTARYKSDVHLRQALADRDVTLLTDTCAGRLVVGPSGRVEQLVCHLPDRSQRTIAARTYVIAANAIGTARLLLMSAQERHPRGLANGSGAVGRYYMGHPVLEQLAQLRTQVMAQRLPFTISSRHFEDGEHLREGVGFRMMMNGADQSPTVHGLRLVEQGLYGAELKQRWKQLATHGVKASIVADCLPRAENRVELDPEHRDYFGQPGLQMHYSYSEYDQRGRELATRSLARVLEHMGATHVDHATYDMAHQMGTTRMGDDPATSVVNRDLRAHEADNLYISGGSVFPNALGATNPTLTIAALSLRLAHHLKEHGL